jgi:cytochrome c556
MLAVALGSAMIVSMAVAGEAPERHLPEAGYLPAAARMLLHAEMQRHGGQMRSLMWSTVTFDFDATAATARAIVAEPRIARPTTHDATQLNSLLPERFFALQDQLRERAAELATAAAAHDRTAIDAAYVQVERTCVACHESYLDGRHR